MQLGGYPARYSKAAILLHWTIAAALAFQISLGWRMEDMAKGPELFWVVQLHKSVGITILLLTLARIAIRFTVRRPAPELDGRWQRALAGAVHFGLYAVMLGGPLTGWLIVSTSRTPVPTLLFGVVPWPDLPVTGRDLHELAESAHGVIAWLLVGLFLLHVAGAVRHQWLLRQPLMERMLPFARTRVMVLPMFLGMVALFLAALVAAKLVGPGQAAAVPAAEPAPPAVVAVPPPAEPAPPVENAVEATENETAAMIEVPRWTVAPGGRLGFRARWGGTPIDGSFAGWTSDIRFDPAALDRSSIRVTVDLASATSGDAQRDVSLQSADFFDTASHPKAMFVSNTISAAGRNRYRARGTLDLKGAKRPVTLDFTLAITGDRAKVSGATTLDRTAFGVGLGEWASTTAIPADVAVDFTFTARHD